MSIESHTQEATPNKLEALHKQGVLSNEAYARSLELIGQPPRRMTWASFFDHTFLFLGIALFLSGVVFFFAYNWSDLGRFSRFAVIEVGIVIALGIAWYRGIDTITGKVSILAGAFLIGPFFAVFGQTYQTGADAYSLFLVWGLLSLPLVIASRFAAAWFFWIVILNLTVPLFLQQEVGFKGDSTLIHTTIFLLNVGIWFVWELFEKRLSFLQTIGRWAPRTIMTYAMGALTILIVMKIVGGYGKFSEGDLPDAFAFILYIGTIAGIIYKYQFRHVDLFPLTLLAINVIIVSTALIVNRVNIRDFDFLWLGLLITIEAGAAVFWLNWVNKTEGGQK